MAALSSGFVEREVEVGLLILGLIAEEHVLLIGDPGTAKSAVVTALCGMLGGPQFSLLFTRFTTPEEVFGPLSLKALEQDRYERVTKGYLPNAKVAFADEIFKANSAILNTLLPILNERIYFEAGAKMRVPLELCVGASNELPDEDASLGALFDRFLLRRIVQPIAKRENFARYLNGGDIAPSGLIIKPADLARARLACRKMPVPPQAINALIDWKENLLQNKVVVSDRRWKKAVKILRASAVFNGRSTVMPSDFEILPEVLWQTPDQIDPLRLYAKRSVRW